MTPASLRKSLLVFSVMGFMMAVLGCGYAFSPQGEHIGANIRTIYVAPFGNMTAQAQLENDLRTAFIDQILSNSRFKTVSSAGEADAILTGNVLSFTTAALSYRRSILAAEERAVVTMEVTLRETADGKTLWSSRGVTGSVDYQLDDDINLLPSARKNSLAKLARDTAERAWTLMMSNF